MDGEASRRRAGERKRSTTGNESHGERRSDQFWPGQVGLEGSSAPKGWCGIRKLLTTDFSGSVIVALTMQSYSGVGASDELQTGMMRHAPA